MVQKIIAARIKMWIINFFILLFKIYTALMVMLYSGMVL